MTPAVPASELLHTPAEAARLLAVPEWRVREWIRSGRLAARRLGGTPQHPRKPRVTAGAIRDMLAAFPDYRPATPSPSGERP